MSFLYIDDDAISPWIKERKQFHPVKWYTDIVEALSKSSTLYVGNLSFYTTEEQIYTLFSKIGEIKRIIMGLNKLLNTPCGFCFVEYYNHKNAVDARSCLSGLRLDDRPIRIDIDWGFEDGRQYGRGKSGYQARDENRIDYDPERGGWGIAALKPEIHRNERRNYRDRSPRRNRSRSPVRVRQNSRSKSPVVNKDDNDKFRSRSRSRSPK